MTSFGYWADRVPHGHFLCSMCYEAFPLDRAATDRDGDRVDVCIPCWEGEAIAGQQAEWRAGTSDL